MRDPARPLRVVLVAPASDRARWQARARDAGLTIVGEAESIAQARRIDGADAFLVAPANADATASTVLVEALTPREMQVLELLAEGLPNKAIAARLDISDQTVKFHVAAICGKLDAANRTDAVRKAVRRGLLTL